MAKEPINDPNLAVYDKDGGLLQVALIQRDTRVAIYGDGGEWLVTDWETARKLAWIIIGMTNDKALAEEE